MSDIFIKACVTVFVLLVIGWGLNFLFNDKLSAAPKESKFFTDTNGCQYFKKSERPRFNPNGTQVCKPL